MASNELFLLNLIHDPHRENFLQEIKNLESRWLLAANEQHRGVRTLIGAKDLKERFHITEEGKNFLMMLDEIRRHSEANVHPNS